VTSKPTSKPRPTLRPVVQPSKVPDKAYPTTKPTGTPIHSRPTNKPPTTLLPTVKLSKKTSPRPTISAFSSPSPSSHNDYFKKTALPTTNSIPSMTASSLTPTINFHSPSIGTVSPSTPRSPLPSKETQKACSSSSNGDYGIETSTYSTIIKFRFHKQLMLDKLSVNSSARLRILFYHLYFQENVRLQIKESWHPVHWK